MVEYKYKICLVGEPAVGKTSLIKRFVYNMFSDKYMVTIGTNIYKKKITLNGENITLMIWDIMGSAGFRQILKTAYFFGADGLLAVGDLTRPDTFETLDEWVTTAIECVNKEIPVILLANKSDLEWKMTEEDVAEYAMDIFARNYFITSAKTGDNVNRAFMEMARILRRD